MKKDFLIINAMNKRKNNRFDQYYVHQKSFKRKEQVCKKMFIFKDDI